MSELTNTKVSAAELFVTHYLKPLVLYPPEERESFDLESLRTVCESELELNSPVTLQNVQTNLLNHYRQEANRMATIADDELITLVLCCTWVARWNEMVDIKPGIVDAHFGPNNSS